MMYPHGLSTFSFIQVIMRDPTLLYTLTETKAVYWSTSAIGHCALVALASDLTATCLRQRLFGLKKKVTDKSVSGL